MCGKPPEMAVPMDAVCCPNDAQDGAASPLAEHVGDGGEELVGVRKVAVYAGKAYVGNLVDLVEAIHDEFSKPLRSDLIPVDCRDDAIDQVPDLLVRHGPVAAGDPYAALELPPVERLAAPVALHHDDLVPVDLFVCREPEAA